MQIIHGYRLKPFQDQTPKIILPVPELWICEKYHANGMTSTGNRGEKRGPVENQTNIGQMQFWPYGVSLISMLGCMTSIWKSTGCLLWMNFYRFDMVFCGGVIRCKFVSIVKKKHGASILDTTSSNQKQISADFRPRSAGRRRSLTVHGVLVMSHLARSQLCGPLPISQ